MIDDRTTANVAVITDLDAEETAERCYLVVTIGAGQGARTRVVPLPGAKEVTFGRLPSCTIHVEHDSVSRTHARVVKRGAHVTVADLDSRNGTWINGKRIKAAQRVSPGDEIVVGPATAILAITTSMRRRSVVGSVSDLEDRLGAEVDRAARYGRKLGLVMLRLEGPGDGVVAALDHVAATLRRMDLLAEYGPDEFAVVLPEADKLATGAVMKRMARETREVAKKYGQVTAHAGCAVFPEDGSHADELVSCARAALRAARTGVTSARTPTSGVMTLGAEGVVALDPVMKRVFALAKRIADATITVLVVGETGVGKEVVAEAIHRDSARNGKPFVKLNCASLPETLLERELFGHEKGAFTGADRQKIGYFEAAAGGTIFLDEIGELPASAQAKLLGVLERRTITRLGGTAELPVDVRVLCATNRDLETEVSRGRFREDLYFRISAFVIPVPPVRDRRSEIVPLATQFARQFARELGQKSPPSFSDEALALLQSYAWPGNVRELRNAVERAVVLHSGGVIDETHLPDRIRDQAAGGAQPLASAEGDSSLVGVRQRVAIVERDAVSAALEADRGNQTQAAKRLGVSRFALIRLMAKYGLRQSGPIKRK